MSQFYLFFIFLLNRKWLIIGLSVAFLFLFMTPPPGLGNSAWRSMGLCCAAVIWFASKSVGPAVMALLIIIFPVVLGISSNEEVVRSFFSDSVFFIMGVLMLGAAVIKQRLDRTLAHTLIFLAGGSRIMFVLYLVCFAAITTAMIGEYAASALLLPFVLTFFDNENIPERRRRRAKPYLLALAFGCIVGGMAAPSGGARNVVVMQFLREHHKSGMFYSDWIRYSFPLFLLLIIMTVFILYRSFFRKGYFRHKKSILFSREDWVRPLSGEDKTAVLIFAIILSLWLLYSSTLGMGIVALFGASLFLIFGLVKWEDYNKNVNWGIVLLYAAVVMLGSSLYDKGAVDWAAVQLTGLLGGKENVSRLLPFITALLIPIVSNIMGAIGAISIFGPFILKLSCLSGLNCVAMGVFTAVASSFAHISFSASPASSIVYSTGYLKSSDFAAVGWKITVLSVIVLLFISEFWWSLY